ncbi:exo-beta-N-acetylmuramidase NamZ family protein [Ruminiclostridium cellobioparum]|uniref:exo-beta-N-acetylmuramidase NamZ family protein n=1 Tax=Ruminiclostridium cellobioparum TaxID=29355 RepID=UPI000482760D|nr:DUF1343 domain-containing protein [Ruminiclostridium cellobioparum]
MVLNGLEQTDKYNRLFKGKRIGLITSPSGVDNNFNSTISIFHKKYKLAALFSPEHGVRGDIEAGALVDTYLDPYTGVQVYSLYRKDSKRLTKEMLDLVDIVVYDIQDVGTRYFTFINTMLYALEDCANSGREFAVLDRINPLDGVTVEGNILKPEFKSFVGAYPLCMRYGLTIGEFAIMTNDQMNFNCKLHVIPCEGWDRKMLFPDTKRRWVMPTMGIPRFDTALLYPGTCLFEGTNMSEGRGTTCPFEIIGAPFIDGQKLADEMNRRKLPGVLFRPVHFKPTASKFNGEKCEGVQVHITDYSSVLSVDTGIELLFRIKDMYSEEFEFLPSYKGSTRQFIDLLSGDDAIRNEKMDRERLLDSYRQESAGFARIKAQYHLYGG